jgi:hypothetical protein
MMNERDKILRHFGELLLDGEEHDFQFAGIEMGLKGQLTEEGHITAFQLWPGDNSTLFISFVDNRLPTPKRAALSLVKMMIDHLEEKQPDGIDVAPFHKEVYSFINSPEGEALREETI